MDKATGLTYMQQRYYDPGIGMLLSVDPVTAFSDPVGQFHRYRYANNNPFKFTDPDGRMIRRPWDEPWRGQSPSGPFRSTNPLSDCRFCLGEDGGSQASNHYRTKAGGSDHGSLTGALADDASEAASDRDAWVNAGKEMLEEGADTLFEPFKMGAEFAECAATCAFREFIGDSPDKFAYNARKEAALQSAEGGLRDAKMGREADLVRGARRMDAWSTVGFTLHCAISNGCQE